MSSISRWPRCTSPWFYYAHIDEMREIERENEAAFDQVRDSSLKPKETI